MEYFGFWLLGTYGPQLWNGLLVRF